MRKYHDHPANTGDNWLLHGGYGEGGLFFIADKISTYGVETITAWQTQMRNTLHQGLMAA